MVPPKSGHKPRCRAEHHRTLQENMSFFKGVRPRSVLHSTQHQLASNWIPVMLPSRGTSCLPEILRNTLSGRGMLKAQHCKCERCWAYREDVSAGWHSPEREDGPNTYMSFSPVILFQAAQESAALQVSAAMQSQQAGPAMSALSGWARPTS